MAQRQQWSRLPGVGTITRPQATLRQLWVPFPSLLRSATTDNHTQTGQEMPCTTGLEDSLPKGSQAQLYLFHSIRSHLVVLEELQGWKNGTNMMEGIFFKPDSLFLQNIWYVGINAFSHVSINQQAIRNLIQMHYCPWTPLRVLWWPPLWLKTWVRNSCFMSSSL